MQEELKKRFRPVLDSFLASPPVASVINTTITPNQYRAILRQVYHHTRENPQLQTLATVHFRGKQRDMVRAFFRHAASEIGHDQLALNDYITLGGKGEHVPYENPLPATTALLSFGFYQIYNLNPLGYLGYLYFLEAMPTQAGPGLIEQLHAVGIKDNALTFLRDHTEIDIGHVKMMEKYIDHLVRDEKEVDCIVYAMQTTAYLYSQMMAQAIEFADQPDVTGWNWEELDADRLTPPLGGASVSVVA